MDYVQVRLISSNYRYDERSFQDGEGLDHGVLGCVHIARWRTASPKYACGKKGIRSERSVIIRVCSLKQREVILPTLYTFSGSNSFSDVEFMPPACIQKKYRKHIIDELEKC